MADHEFQLRGEHVVLCDLLKLTGIADSGGAGQALDRQRRSTCRRQAGEPQNRQDPLRANRDLPRSNGWGGGGRLICCDEKSQALALDRNQPGLPLKRVCEPCDNPWYRVRFQIHFAPTATPNSGRSLGPSALATSCRRSSATTATQVPNRIQHYTERVQQTGLLVSCPEAVLPAVPSAISSTGRRTPSGNLRRSMKRLLHSLFLARRLALAAARATS